MRYFSIAIALLVAACGQVLDEGVYFVGQTVVSDTCGGATYQTASWRISEADGDWTLTNTSNDFTASGREVGDRLIFETSVTTIVNSCTLDIDYVISLMPQGDTFEGTITANGHALCDNSTCTIQWAVNGSRE